MLSFKKKIVVTGGSGRFGEIFKENSKNFKFSFFFPKKNQLNILQISTIKKYLKYLKPNYLIHLAGLSRPMKIHEQDIIQSIDKNIIGTANITKVCSELNIKLIYISTCYVYPGIKGNYKETDHLMPVNSYGWSKLGGECAVKLYKNSLILRICMTEDTFPHKIAYTNYITSFLKKSDAAKIILKLINKKGIMNIGGETSSAYDFAKKNNKEIKRGIMPKNKNNLIGYNTSLNIKKFKSLNYF